MEKRPINVLLIGDDPAYTEILERTTGDVKDFNLKFEKALSIDKGLKRLSKDGIDVVLLDLSIKENRGLETLGEVHDAAKDLPIAVISNLYNQMTAEKAFNKGASDYLNKEGLTPSLLARSISSVFFKTHMEGTQKKAQEDSKIQADERTKEVREIYEQMVVEFVERKRVEQELRESEEKYRILVENANDGIVIIQDGLIKYTNQRFFTIIGYKTEELIDKSFIDYIHPDDVEKVSDLHKRRMAGEDVASIYESAIRHKDGHKIDVEFNASVFLFNEKPAVLAIVRDITERKRAEEAIKESEERWRILFENSIEAVFTVDIRGNFTSINKAASILLGIEQEKLIGINYKKYMKPETAKKVFKAYNHLYQTGEPVRDISYEVISKDGGVRTIEGYINVIRKGDKIIGFQGTMRDITERKRTEEALQDSEERFRTLIENSSDAIAIIDDNGTIRYVSQANERVQGFRPEELIGKNFSELVYQDDLSEIFNVFNDLVNRKTDTASIICRSLHKDGSLRILEAVARNLLDDPKICGIVLNYRDITERKKSEGLLRESEERYRNLVENLNDVIFNVDMEGNFTYISPAIERISKYHADEIIGKPFTRFVHPEEIPLLYEIFRYDISDISKSYEFRVLDKDGEFRYVRTSSRAHFKDKKPVGITGVMTDITVEKRAQEALRQSEEKFRSLFETSKDVVYLSTIGGRFLEINSAAEELFGYTRDELLSINIRDLYLNPDNRKIFQNKIEKEGFVKDYDITFKRKNGTIVNSLTTAAVRRDGEGKVIGYQGIIRDITEWKKMEAQLIRTEKLASLGEIISGVAHEMNNPLTSIIGNTQLLLRRDIPQNIKDKLQTIERESIRCSKIVGGLLTFAKEHRPEKNMVNLNDIVNNSLNLLEYELRVDNISLDLNLSPDLPVTSADPHQFQQVFINLIKNAQYAIKEKGGGKLTIQSFHQDDKITIELIDNGIGIPKENLKKVLDPFFTTKEVGKGTGLGLSIVFGIINEHGGRIDVESEVGKGSKFRIILPVTTGSIRDEYIKISKSKKPNRSISILLVEDEDSLRNYISEVLSLEGYVIKACAGGEEAVQLLKTNKYDAIISDIKMPGMNGQDIYASISEKNPELLAKILFITGDVLGKKTQTFLKTTKCNYIEKPFDIDILLNKINEIVSSQ